MINSKPANPLLSPSRSYQTLRQSRVVENFKRAKNPRGKSLNQLLVLKELNCAKGRQRSRKIRPLSLRYFLSRSQQHFLIRFSHPFVKHLRLRTALCTIKTALCTIKIKNRPLHHKGRQCYFFGKI